MRSKLPWIDRERCDIAERGEECKAAHHCRYNAFQVIRSDNGSGEGYKVGIDFEKCRLCGDCSHACDLGAVKMV
jgi:NAD-dependent dihydropyrimidine dehydrogenase PreA subunit